VNPVAWLKRWLVYFRAWREHRRRLAAGAPLEHLRWFMEREHL
jgi:hypothetical protein